MVRRILLSAAACVFAFGLSAAEYVTEIEMLKGEKWWGLNYDGKLKQPIEQPLNAIDTENKYGGYENIMVSNTGRYIYSAHPITINFDGAKFQITSEYEKVEVQKGGRTLRETYVVCALKNLKPGESPDPQMFALPVYETEYEIGYAQGGDEIVGYAEKLIAGGFPPGIIVVADGWQKVSGPYEFDPEIYPDPKRMVDRLHALGFKVMLTVTPFVPNWGSVYGAAKRDGQLYSWGSHSAVSTLDMGNEAQFTRLKTGFDKIKATCGFDGFRFRITWENDSLSDSKHKQNMMSLGEGLEMVQYIDIIDRPYAPYLSSMPLFSRLRDTPPFEERLMAVKAVVTAGLMGFPYVQTEVFNGEILKDQRGMADYLLLQCGMPVVSVDFAPWRITDPALYQGVKDALNFRASLGDYVTKLVEDSRRTGEPLARHMEYQFPGNAFYDCTDQFMLGTKYLFAPCVDGADKRMVRFPKGTWIGPGGEKIKGPVVKQADCSAGGLICFEAAK